MHVPQVREEEIKLMSRTAVIKIINLCVVFAVPPLLGLVIFATYVFNQGPFDSTFAFTVLSLFNTMRFPLVVLPKALRGSSGEQWGRSSPGCVTMLHGSVTAFLARTFRACSARLHHSRLPLPHDLVLCVACAEAIASMQRLQKYLLLEEHDDPPKSKVVEARFVSGS